MVARIYKPAKTAMQSGVARTLEWVLENEPETRREIDPLIGWTSAAETNTQVTLRFATKDEAVAYAEREGKNIEVYEPYLAGTHDEKMFRVVKDRAQWFDIVMGRQTSIDEELTDVEETRVPLHSRIREALIMDLRSPD